MRTPQHLVSYRDLIEFGLPDLLERTQDIKRMVLRSRGRGRWPDSLHGHIVASLFYEASTRTRLSFESVALRMGGKLIGTENAEQFSSAIKGESLTDSIRIVSMYADAIVLRHVSEGAAAEAALVSQVPVINAGDGTGEHPTQALLDFYTIWEHFQSDVTLTVVGDLKNGRTVHSLLKLAAELSHTELGIIKMVRCVAPEPLALPRALWEQLRASGVGYSHTDRLDAAAVKGTDVLYLTRTQKERGSEIGNQASYSLTEAIDSALPHGAIVMHPLPRNEELPTWFDDDPRAKYFEQAQNGLFARAALLDTLFS